MKAGHGAEVAASAAASTASAAAAAADGDVAAAGIRTVALAGKDGCGKTALASALLALAASKRNAKGVDGGAPEETAHGMTLYNHVYCAQVDDHRVNLIDTCGHIDRLPLLATALAVSTASVFVTTPTVGVDGACKRVWERVADAGVPAVAFVNCFRLSESAVEAGGHPAGRFAAALHSIEASLGQLPVVLFAPTFDPDTGAFLGLIDVLAGALCRDDCRFLSAPAADRERADGLDALPPSAVAEAAAYREHAVEALADVDDAVMGAYLDGGVDGVSAAALATALRTAVASRSVLPVIAGSAAEGVGVRALDDLLRDCTPAFGEGAGWPAHDGGAAAEAGNDGEDGDGDDAYAAEQVYTSGADALAEAAWRRAGGPVSHVAPDATAPVAGIVYGLSLHAYSGRLTEVLVVSGTLTKHAKLVLNAAAGGGGGAATGGGAGGGGRVSPARLLRRRPGGALEEVTSAGPGELVCLEKIDGAAYGDTLTCAERSALQLRPLPRPYGRCTFTLPVGDDSRADDKLLRALGRLAEEDPSLRLSRNEETGELLLSGTGLLHLGIVRERLATEAKIDLPLATPHVAYHETLTGRPVRAPGRLVKQSGGSGQYAVVEVEVTPLPRGGGFVWADSTKGGIVTKSFSAAAGRGAAEALKAGPLGGFPLTDVSCTLVDGKMHSVDSSENAFFHATASAVRAAAAAAADKGHAALLEPIMHLAVTVEEAHMGRISKDLATRRGRLSGFRPASEDLGLVVVEASVPLAELLTYSKTLDALTSGTGSFTMAVERYEEVTSHAAAAVLGTRRGGAAVDAKAAGGKGGGGKRKR